ncbi:hypothetical protein MKC73_01030 [[Clostridium] innocuum]|nr:hypothetical protein [[Clostridium] innocuum]
MIGYEGLNDDEAKELKGRPDHQDPCHISSSYDGEDVSRHVATWQVAR